LASNCGFAVVYFLLLFVANSFLVPSFTELADIAEVLRSLSSEIGSSPEELEALRRERAEQRGGFEKRVFLLETIER
jgi:hypothetical protein